MLTPFCTLQPAPSCTPVSTKQHCPSCDRSPMEACSRTFVQFQILTPSPSLASPETSAVGCTKVVLNKLIPSVKRPATAPDKHTPMLGRAPRAPHSTIVEPVSTPLGTTPLPLIRPDIAFEDVREDLEAV